MNEGCGKGQTQPSPPPSSFPIFSHDIVKRTGDEVYFTQFVEPRVLKTGGMCVGTGDSNTKLMGESKGIFCI